MTDKETIKAMLQRTNIPFAEVDAPLWAGGFNQGSHKDAIHEIRVEDGYLDFFTCFSFDKDGALVRLAAWE